MALALLDTHILIWWRLDTARLSRQQVQTLLDSERRREPLAISAITLRELSMLGARGRIEVTLPWDIWLQEIETSPLLSVLPITAKIAAESVRLGPDFPKDPADQIIVATARCHGLSLITADEDIRRWGKVPMI